MFFDAWKPNIDSTDDAATPGPLRSAVKRIVMYEFTTIFMEKMGGPVPLAVQIRNILNANGFRFKDDGKVSAVINENPEPLGKMTRWCDFETGSVFYKQELNT